MAQLSSQGTLSSQNQVAILETLERLSDVGPNAMWVWAQLKTDPEATLQSLIADAGEVGIDAVEVTDHLLTLGSML